jgi:hypothetical protein
MGAGTLKLQKIASRGGRVTMIRRVTLGFVTATLAGALLILPVPVDAQTCSTNTDCGPGNTCAVKFDF